MQASTCEFLRAWTKFGTATALNSPMMATTIMISTRVNPGGPFVVFFILDLTFRLWRERSVGSHFLYYVLVIIAHFVHINRARHNHNSPGALPMPNPDSTGNLSFVSALA